MSTFQWQDLIDRARTYVDDDNNDSKGWISTDRWLTLFRVEYEQLYRKWLRMGLVSPTIITEDFVATDASGTGGDRAQYILELDALAVIGVAEKTVGGGYRMLTPSQSAFGREPYWQGANTFANKATSWALQHGPDVGDNGTFTDSSKLVLDPPDISSTYTVKYVPSPATAINAVTQTVTVPNGTDERIVLGAAKRALVKESSRSAALQDLITEADAELNFSAFAKINGDGPRVRKVMPTARARSWQAHTFPSDPRFWTYL